VCAIHQSINGEIQYNSHLVRGLQWLCGPEDKACLQAPASGFCMHYTQLLNTSQPRAAAQSTFYLLYLLWRIFETRDDDAVALSVMTLIRKDPVLNPANLWPPLLRPAFLHSPYTIIRPPHLLKALEALFERF
jgi:hypothetical protein